MRPLPPTLSPPQHNRDDERYAAAKGYGVPRYAIDSGVLYFLLNKEVEYKSATQRCSIAILVPGTKKSLFILDVTIKNKKYTIFVCSP